MKYKKAILFICKYVLGVVLVCYIFSFSKNLPLPDVKGILTWRWLPILLFFKLIYAFAAFLRWHYILKQLHIISNLKTTVKLSLMGYSMNYVLPGSVSGDALKGVFLNKSAQSPKKVFLSLFFDRIMGLFTVLLLVAAQFLWLFWSGDGVLLRFSNVLQFEKLYSFLIGAAFGVVILAAVLWQFRRHSLIAQVVDLARQFSAGRSIWWAQGLSLLSHLSGIAFLYTATQALGLEISLMACVFMFSFTSFVVVLPITPGGLGVGQASYNYLLNLYNNEQTLNGATLFTIMQFFDLIFVFIGGAILLYTLIKKKRELSQN